MIDFKSRYANKYRVLQQGRLNNLLDILLIKYYKAMRFK